MTPTLTSNNDFACLKLSEDILRQLDKLGFTTPTPIQNEAIPHALEGQDVIGIAQTGTGKTFAFGLPMIQKLLGTEDLGLIMAPTRELALQIEEEFKKIGAPLGIRTAVLIGGAPMNRQVSDLRRRPNVIIATPGRLKDHLWQRTTNLRRLTMVVLDEADRMLDMGFAPAVKQILDQAPEKRQTMLFSATMAKEVLELASQYLTEPVRVEIAPQGTASELVEQQLHVVEHENKNDLLSSVLYESEGTVLVFARTRHGARKVARNVRSLGITAAELHSDRTLAQRKTALAGFKSGEFRVLVATDIAARGIDVKEIGLVINYDLPDCLEDYVHRIGRTGRAGSFGRAVTFALPNQHRDVRQIERIIGKELAVVSGTLPEASAVRPNRAKVSKAPIRTERPRREHVAVVRTEAEVRPTYSREERAPRPERSNGPMRDSRPFESRGPRNEDRRDRNERPAARFEERPRYERRGTSEDRPFNSGREDRKPYGNRPFNSDRNDRGGRFDKPYGRERDERQSFSERPRYERSDRTSRFDDRSQGQGQPRFERSDRGGRFGNRPADSDRPRFGNSDRSHGSDRPRFEGSGRPERPFGGNRDFREKRSFNSQDRPYENRSRDDRPRYNDNDRPFNRDSRPDRGFNKADKPRWEKRDRPAPARPETPKPVEGADAVKRSRPKPSGTPKQFKKPEKKPRWAKSGGSSAQKRR